MFGPFGWLTGRTRRPARRQDGAFRSIETRRGTYFVRWDPDAVSALIDSEGLSADDLGVQDPSTRQRLARDLLLLGLKDELLHGPQPSGSAISRLARSLIRMGSPAGRTAPTVACFSPAT
jgi:hypothetical protein